MSEFPKSSPVSGGDKIRAEQYNDLRDDVIAVGSVNPFYQVYDSPGEYTWNNPGAKLIEVEVVGGGGRSTHDTNQQNNGGGGGGGGGYARKIIDVSEVESVDLIVGNYESTSSFGDYCSATGGSRGGSSSGYAVAEGGVGGEGIGGDVNLKGQSGTWGRDAVSHGDGIELPPVRGVGGCSAIGKSGQNFRYGSYVRGMVIIKVLR